MTHAGEFRIGVLGPLEVTWEGRRAPIRGFQQRAVLGYLSLHANSAVATSDLIKALWRSAMPSTARKMLQNAVAGVRAALAGSPAELLTHAPGYLLRVEPEAIDLCRFTQLAELGRHHLIAGDLVAAASTLQEALGQWRGAILADLAESGIDWPEMEAAQNARLAVLEDYAEAQVARGNYQEVIERLGPAIAGIPTLPRERLSAQLMISLYRSGRQADALGVYRQTRSALVEQTGLDPSRYLQDLEKAMLAHDPMLTARPRSAPAEEVAPISASQGQQAEVVVSSELKPVTVLLVRAGVADPAQEHDPEDVRAAWRDLGATMTEVVAKHRGLVRRGAIGSLWTVWFGVPQTGDDDVERAVRAAHELRQELRGKGQQAGRLAFQLAVASGEALVRWGGSYDGEIEVTGGVLDVAFDLLTSVGLAELRICDTTRRLAGWALKGPRQDPALLLSPMIERDREMRLLRRILEDVALDRRPNLLTVLGEPGIGKTRLVNEFLGQMGQQAYCVAVLGAQNGGASGEVLYEVNSALRAVLETELVHDGTVEGVVQANHRAIEQLAAVKPVVLVMEDLHGADQRVLDYLDDLMCHAAALPLLIVAVARLEWQARHRHWRASSGVDTTIKLEPLSDTGMRQLLKAMLDGSDQNHPAVVEEIVSRVRGNPKLAVEYAQHVDEVVAGEPDPPAAVQRLIAAQLDRLPARQKATIQDAAVLGDLVSASALAAVSGRSAEEVRQQLRVLEARVLMRRAVRFAPADGAADRYEFWNPLVRDVAYAQIPRCIRATKHSRAATWLSGVGEGAHAEYHTRQAAPLTMTIDECDER